MAEKKKGLGIASPSQPQGGGEGGLVADLVRVLSALTSSNQQQPQSPPPEQIPGLGGDRGGVFGWAGPGDSRGQMSSQEVYDQVFKPGNRPVADYWPAPGPVGGRLAQPVAPSASHELQILLRALGLGGGN